MTSSSDLFVDQATFDTQHMSTDDANTALHRASNNEKKLAHEQE